MSTKPKFLQVDKHDRDDYIAVAVAVFVIGTVMFKMPSILMFNAESIKDAVFAREIVEYMRVYVLLCITCMFINVYYGDSDNVSEQFCFRTNGLVAALSISTFVVSVVLLLIPFFFACFTSVQAFVIVSLVLTVIGGLLLLDEPYHAKTGIPSSLFIMLGLIAMGVVAIGYRNAS